MSAPMDPGDGSGSKAGPRSAIEAALCALSSLVLSAVCLAALAWWWLMPAGFPVLHGRFWSNRVLPWAWIALSLAGIWAYFTRRDRVLGAVAAAPGLGLLAAAITVRIVYPLSAGASRWWLLTAAGVLLVVLAAGTLRVIVCSRRASIAVACPFALSAVWFVIAMRSPPPSTLPGGAALPALEHDADPSPRGWGPSAQGVIEHSWRGLRVEMAPLLTFESRSPDAGWTLFAPASLRDGPPRRWLSGAQTPSGWSATFADDGESTLQVTARQAAGLLEVDAHCSLGHTVFSHLNYYARLLVTGHDHLSLELSPCPGHRIDVLPADYPAGRPHRFAYLGSDDRLHVVEAEDAEKGPFHELASGPLRRGQPLTITLWSAAEPILRVRFDDWAAQASTDLSPSGGWGVPQNAIHFVRLGEADTSPCAIDLTLAATGIGRGFDSVGHARGVYRNRMHVEPAR